MPKQTKPSTPPPKPAKPKRNPRGRIKGAKTFKPTPEQRNLVLMAVGWLIPRDQIARLIVHPATGVAISETSMEKYFRKELLDGAAQIRVMHARALFKQVTDGNVTAAIWWDKTRNHIGQHFNGRDRGEEKPPAQLVIDETTTDIVVIARRMAFTLAMAMAQEKKALALKPKPKAPPTPRK